MDYRWEWGEAMNREKKQEAVEFKGTKRGLMIGLHGQHPFDELLGMLKAKLDKYEHFFKDGQVTVQVHDRRLGVTELNLLTNLFKHESSLRLSEIISGTGEVLVKFPSEYQSELGKREDVDYRINNSIVIRRTIRSGQKVEFPGTIVVLGNVNPGAELVARGDIIVFGELKGICHAGADGDGEAAIMALKLKAKQLRIASLVTRAPDDAMIEPDKPERAIINGNQIVVEPIDQEKMNLDKLPKEES